jgi:hypothetical protein
VISIFSIFCVVGGAAGGSGDVEGVWARAAVLQAAAKATSTALEHLVRVNETMLKLLPVE